MISAGIIRELHGIPGGLRCEKGDPGERGEKGERGDPGHSFSDGNAVRSLSISFCCNLWMYFFYKSVSNIFIFSMVESLCMKIQSGYSKWNVPKNLCGHYKESQKNL